MIPGGYVLQPRSFDSSESSKMAPVVRELWFYLLRNVNHKDNGQFKRGSGFFNLGDIQNDLCWYSGYRKNTYSKPQLSKALRKLHEGNMVDTTKETRGVFITIRKYELYQDPKNYEGNAKATRRKRSGHTINKNVKECKNERNNYKELAAVVFEYWKKIHNHPRSMLDDSRIKLISKRLGEGYKVDDLKKAIDGCKKSTFHQGDNDNKKVYDDIGLILRDASKVDTMMGYLVPTGKERI